jgi:hypothetical protein
MRFFTFISALVLVSCSVGPTTLTRTAPNGTRTEVTTAGVSILTRNRYESTDVSNGSFTASHVVHEKDEVAVPRYSAQGQAAAAAGSGVKTITNAITR